MTCPLLEYRDGDDDHAFDVERAYCTAVDAFVQPMRADVCNDRYDLHHAEDCEYYRDHVDDAREDDATDDAREDDATDDASEGDATDDANERDATDDAPARGEDA
jgi:hypothetical protein